MEIITKIIPGDCREQLKSIEDNSIDLIITSPPYADQRKNSYGGIHPNKYVEWFLKLFTDEEDCVLDPLIKYYKITIGYT